MAKPLNILYMSHYFPPEVNAPAVRVSDMSARWAKCGAQVTVLTGFPNHPSGVIPPSYRGARRAIEARAGVKVVRTWMYAAPNKGFLKRILNYLSFMVSSLVLGASRVGRPDILIATSPQFFVALAGYVMSRIKRCKFVFEIRDLWPEEIVAVGAIRNRAVIHMLERLETFLYRKADLLVAVARGTIDVLVERGIPREKMVLIPNGVILDEFAESGEGEQVRRALGLGDKFVVGYVGTHGMAHRLDTVLSCAALLNSHDDIHFLFVGDGAEKQSLIARARELGLANVTFHNQVPRRQIASFYQACDVCVVPLRQAELFTKNIPSKIYEIMASRRAIIIATEGESRRLVESSGAGVGSQPENAKELSDRVLELKRNPETCRRMGQDGYTFALANCSRLRLADQYLEILKEVVTSRFDGTPGQPKGTKSDEDSSRRLVEHRQPVSY